MSEDAHTFGDDAEREELSQGAGPMELPIVVVAQGLLSVDHERVLVIAAEFCGKLLTRAQTSGGDTLFIEFEVLEDAVLFYTCLEGYKLEQPYSP
jgi:hypothetical protein